MLQCIGIIITLAGIICLYINFFYDLSFFFNEEVGNEKIYNRWRLVGKIITFIGVFIFTIGYIISLF